MELFRKKNSKYFWYDFTVRGKRYRGSTKETNPKRAAKVAALEFSQVCKYSDPLPRKAPTLKQLSARFLDWVECSRLKDKSKLYYQNGWRLLSATNIVHMRIDGISNDDAELVSVPGSESNANCALRTLRRMLHRAEDWKLIRRAAKIKVAEEKSRSIRLDDELEQKLMAGAAQCNWRRATRERFRDIVVMMRDTGMRNERELFQVRIENIAWNRRLIFVPDSKTDSGTRHTVISDRVLDLLRKRCGNRREGWLFPSERSETGHLTTISGHFRQARKKAGLPKQLVLYCARHDFGTRVLQKTGNLKLVMNTMGHLDVKTAMKYQHPDHEAAREAINATNAAAAQHSGA